MADPKVPDPELTSQGQIYKRALDTDENLAKLEADYRGRGATPQQKEDESKTWISKGHTIGEEGPTHPPPDKIAQVVNDNLGPISYVKDKIADAVEIGMGKASATSNSVRDTTNSATGTFSQYTQAAWDKMNQLKPAIGTNHSAPMAEVSESKGPQNASSVAANVKNTMSHAGERILGAGGDDVFKIMGDGPSTQGDPNKANLRATAETLI